MYYALKCKEYQSLFLDKQAFEKVKTQYPHANCKTFSSAKEGLDWIHDKNENIPSIQIHISVINARYLAFPILFITFPSKIGIPKV